MMLRIYLYILLTWVYVAPLQSFATAQEQESPASRISNSDRQEPMPDVLEGVGITEKLGTVIPLDLEFQDSEGQTVRLEQYFNKGKPVILNLGYYGCPMLCGLVMQGMLEALKEMDLHAGTDYEVVTVSIDPSETPPLAKLKKKSALSELDQAGAEEGWHFLVGSESNIAALTDAVGFGFKWNEATLQYAHAAALVVLTPDGTVSRYLYGIIYSDRTMRLSLVEASEGKVGDTLDRFILTCFHYDPKAGTYVVAAENVMRIGGVLTVLALGVALCVAFLRGPRSSRMPKQRADN